MTTQNVGGQLVDQGTLPLSSAAGQLAADFIERRDGARPTLGAEDATIFTGGVAFDLGPTNWTIDAYQIDVDDRIALGANINFLDALNEFNNGPDFATVSEGITGLANAGVINRSDFTGLEDLSQFRFFTNSFDTRTRGVDVVGRLPFDFIGGFSEVTLAGNYNETEVTDRGAAGSIQRISDTRVANLEDQLPNLKGFVQWSHTQDRLRTLLRANYFGEWQDVGNGLSADFAKGAEILVDAEIGYELVDGVEAILGVNNIFDNYPDVNPSAGSLGQLYPEASPTGFTGGLYYTKLRVNF